MYGIHHFELFCVSALILTVTPGPDTFYILGRTMSQGKTSGTASVLGISTGALIHTIAAGIGLSAILASSALLFGMIRFIGAVYLIYLGLTLIFSSKGPQRPGASLPDKKSCWKIYRQGVVTNVLNPKVALFFLSFLPQFIDPSQGHATAFFLLGLIYVLINTLWYLIFAGFSSALAGMFQKNPLWIRTMNRISGGIFIGLGLNLAFAHTE